MSRKLIKGERIIFKPKLDWPEIVTIVECLPQKRFYIQSAHMERSVSRQELLMIPSKYRLLERGDMTEHGDEQYRYGRWASTHLHTEVRAGIYRRLR